MRRGLDRDQLPGYASGAPVIFVRKNQGQIDVVGSSIDAQSTTMRANHPQRMTLVVAHNTGLKPPFSLLYYPGGSFTSADYANFFGLRSTLAKAGLVVAAAEYRAFPDALFKGGGRSVGIATDSSGDLQ